ncbi:MAG: lipid II flippase MurJ [Candidatus Eisenbacteria bacterium]
MGKHEQIWGATWVVAVFSVLMIGAGAARDIFTASLFGASDAIDAFMIAFAVSICFYGVLASVIDSAFLPLYAERLRDQDSHPSGLLLYILLAVSAFLIAVTVVLIMLVPLYMPLVARGFSGSKLLLAERLCQALLVLVFLNGLAGLLKAVHNAHLRFALPSLGNVVVPLCALLFLFLLRDRMGVWTLVWGTIAGAFVRLVVMAPFVLGRIREVPLSARRGTELKTMLVFSSLAIPLLLSAILTQANAVVIQSVASTLERGTVASLAYADRVFQVPVNLIALTLWSSAFPFLSHAWECHELEKFRGTLSWASRLILMVAIPLAAVFVFGGQEIVRLLFMRGAFDAQAAHSTGLVLSISGIGLAPVCWGYVFGRALQATRRMWAFAGVSLLNVTLNGVGCVLLSRWWGIAGIAASGVITFTFSTGVLAFLLRRSTGFSLERTRWPLFGKVAIASLAMVCTARGLAWILSRMGVSSSEGGVVAGGSPWVVGVIVYAVFLLVLRVGEAKSVATRLLSWYRGASASVRS